VVIAALYCNLQFVIMMVCYAMQTFNLNHDGTSSQEYYFGTRGAYWEGQRLEVIRPLG
jgi:hypothetical protein